MKHETQVAWRRNKVSGLLIEGHNQTDIASILKISQSTVNRDIAYLREEARGNMKTHLQDRLPHEYENCLAGINLVLQKSWEIANRGSDSSKNIVDDKTRLQALQLANECYK